MTFFHVVVLLKQSFSLKIARETVALSVKDLAFMRDGLADDGQLNYEEAMDLINFFSVN